MAIHVENPYSGKIFCNHSSPRWLQFSSQGQASRACVLLCHCCSCYKGSPFARVPNTAAGPSTTDVDLWLGPIHNITVAFWVVSGCKCQCQYYASIGVWVKLASVQVGSSVHESGPGVVLLHYQQCESVTNLPVEVEVQCQLNDLTSG